MHVLSERVKFLKIRSCDGEEGMEKKKYEEKPMGGMVRS